MQIGHKVNEEASKRVGKEGGPRMKRMIGPVAVGMLLLSSQLIGAHGEHAHNLSNPEDPVAVRMYLMENVGANTKALKDKIDAGAVKEAQLNAQAIALHALQIPELFPEGSAPESSRAKPEIWQKWDDFVKSAQALREAADSLAQAAGADNADEAKTKLQALFGSCKSCHDGFRKPEEKSSS